MNFVKKIFTAFRGAATEAGEAIIDTQAIRILEQEVRDAKKHLGEAKENLAKVIAEQMGVEREIKRLTSVVEKYEDYAVQALDKGDEKLAIDIAEKAADSENELNAQQSVLEGYNTSISTLKQHIREAERNIKSMEREINVVKTTESVQKANSAAASQFSGSTSALRTASESLERIKQKQQQKADELKASAELQQQESGGDLQEKLRKAGIVQDQISGHNVLERIKAKQTNKSDINF
ncbi:PspA/IM30 family protein [Candidatus Parabeggiatoa sp. HSG14]|uniref:PspA/IM30 family protein n=1 Tax=Candidatus Parabeggiatoa sp. HSG14 TaxID=3055593 RepID=UPI0025A797EE|nr:PspA/IM30 family protein [Thiotrichales bacterium HSG14]